MDKSVKQNSLSRNASQYVCTLSAGGSVVTDNMRTKNNEKW